LLKEVALVLLFGFLMELVRCLPYTVNNVSFPVLSWCCVVVNTAFVNHRIRQVIGSTIYLYFAKLLSQ
jgi:hypothetical protein